MSCCGEACFSTAGARKVACRDVGRMQWEPQPADFPGDGNHVGVFGYGDSPSPPFFSSVSPGPGREVRNGMGWSLLEKTARSGVWSFRGALCGSSAFFAFAAFADWVKNGSFLTAWAVLPLSSCSFSYLHGRESGAGHCLVDCGGLSLPQ